MDLDRWVYLNKMSIEELLKNRKWHMETIREWEKAQRDIEKILRRKVRNES